MFVELMCNNYILRNENLKLQVKKEELDKIESKNIC